MAAGVTAVAGSTLAACGGGEATLAQDDGGSGAGAAPIAAGSSLGPTQDIPVGGGKVFISPAVVVTQPTAGTFKAFSAICTHEGCPVAKVADGVIKCPCHGSEFSIEDGSVKRPPASSPLTAVAITTTGGNIAVA
ncbi:Rieske (2Fe-2S) protein [Sporichthya sp.]|uniref:Rieske (2Fe-2S) protein n=1 Tax=Sporichthya sp. TaxID=65475 RepID=UPI001855390D|nr:Rieske (2Fe-2S) protein [Sporichthya sp.]MBA3744829.1 Rieske (2Fe-2S) protein [Sporichthya sp.]